MNSFIKDILFLGGICVFFILFFKKNNKETKVGQSISFIMGQDKNTSNHFYKNATYYYNMHPVDKTDIVIVNCQTLMDVMDYLSNNDFTVPFKTINLVCHGNPWQGLRVPIDKNNKRASLPNLLNFITSQNYKGLCSSGIDNQTRINIVSCAVGQNKSFESIMKQLFSCKELGITPKVHIEEYYVNFVNNLEKKQAQYFFNCSKNSDSEPQVVSEKLAQKYANLTLDWNGLMNLPLGKEVDGYYKHRFTMLVEWNFIFEKEELLPTLKSENEIKIWLKSQREAIKELELMNLELDDISWHVYKLNPQKGIKIKGYCTIEGIMKDV